MMGLLNYCACEINHYSHFKLVNRLHLQLTYVPLPFILICSFVGSFVRSLVCPRSFIFCGLVKWSEPSWLENPFGKSISLISWCHWLESRIILEFLPFFPTAKVDNLTAIVILQANQSCKRYCDGREWRGNYRYGSRDATDGEPSWLGQLHKSAGWCVVFMHHRLLALQSPKSNRQGGGESRWRNRE